MVNSLQLLSGEDICTRLTAQDVLIPSELCPCVAHRDKEQPRRSLAPRLPLCYDYEIPPYPGQLKEQGV